MKNSAFASCFFLGASIADTSRHRAFMPISISAYKHHELTLKSAQGLSPSEMARTLYAECFDETGCILSMECVSLQINQLSLKKKKKSPLSLEEVTSTSFIYYIKSQTNACKHRAMWTWQKHIQLLLADKPWNLKIHNEERTACGCTSIS